MRLFPPEFAVSLDEGFSPERDLFGRAPIAAGLTRLMERVDQPLVVGLDGDWGSGKTTFLRFWTGELRKGGFPVVFFDAFQNDYADDAFIALAGEVFAAVEREEKSTSTTARKFASKAVAAGKVLLRTSLKVGIKAATMGAVSTTDFDELADTVATEASDTFDAHVGELITRQAAHRSVLDEFRSALSRLPELMSPPAEGEAQKPLVFIIDELDRCRPSFALELLERVKHFFSVPNVHFVLGINSDQLVNSVKAVYGSGIDGRTYLQKFIHLNWTLSQRERYASDKARLKYTNYLMRSYGFSGKDQELAEYASKFAAAVAEVKSLSFRTIERVMAVIALSVATTPDNMHRISPLVGGLALMKTLEPRMFARAKSGRLTYDEVRNFLELSTLEDIEDESWDWTSNWWQYATDPNCPEELIQRFSRSGFLGLGRLDLVSYTAHSVLDDITLK